MFLQPTERQPFTAWIDCQGNLSHTGSGRSASTTAAQPRAHLWKAVWEAFDAIDARKTKAHCSAADVASGATTEWQRRGNNEADYLAKKGAKDHGLTQKKVAEYKVLARR